MALTDYLQVPELHDRYRKLKKYFHIRESAYDVTSRCQLRCDGCYYFQGDKYRVQDISEAERWMTFMRDERERGINYVNLAGAEPALVPDILRACYETIPMGNVFTNGLSIIDECIRYRIHISVWGDEKGDPQYRGVYCLPKQLKNYKNDDRVIFVYTFNKENIDQIDTVAEQVAGAGHQLTFNIFSNPVGHQSNISVDDSARRAIYEKMLLCMERYPESVVYSYYNAYVHTSAQSLNDMFGCPYPRISHLRGGHAGIGRTFRSYRTDFTHVISSDCCIPDTDCADCRHYAAGSAIVSSRMNLHVDSEMQFRGWLDYVDTYLAIWVYGYEKGQPLYAVEGTEDLVVNSEQPRT